MKSIPRIVFALTMLLGALECSGKDTGTVHLYGYMGLEWAPFANVEIVDFRPGVIRFLSAGAEISFSGNYTVVTKKKEKSRWKPWGNGELYRRVILYPFMKIKMYPFGNCSVYEKKSEFIVFEFGDKRYIHSGKYSAEK